jgi:hypothetical protein
LDGQIRVNVRPRVIDWNVARQYHGTSAAAGIPRRATLSEEPVRASANAAFRLRKALDGTGDEPWALLVLVAQYIVFERVGGGGTPLYNHAETEAVSTREAEAHRSVCGALRAELSALRGP